ncbi:MAG: hypothetical protein EB127_11170, partial [Alphaproteobacteria bacterium]|nr:hypothetical protein [Alphaproteobacteria bacterium]
MEWLILGLVVVLSLAFEAVYYSNNTKILGYSIGTAYTLVNLIIVILFGVHIYNAHGPSSASEFTTGFVIEKMLSVDNIVVIKVILNTFN